MDVLNLHNTSMIVALEDFASFSKIYKKHNRDVPLVATSGYFDPLHPGHISCLEESAKFGFLVVIVNGDEQLKIKKGKSFIPHADRCMIVDALECVDVVVPFDHDKDVYAIEPLKVIKPAFFTKGGDRKDIESIPEWDICQKNKTEIVTKVGDKKVWSSSNYLQDWVDFSKTPAYRSN